MKFYLYSAAILFLLTSCFRRPEIPTYNDPIPEHITFNIESKHVNESRVINVWLPPKYDQSDDKFPVLYMPDGGIKEDFPHIANTLAKLIEEQKIPPYILVGIENTERYRDLSGASTVKKHEKYKIPMDDGAKHFRAFILEELKPEINSKYRTSDKSGIIGESLAGLFVVETFFLTPESFDYYMAIDPSLWWNNNFLVKNSDEYFKNLPERNTKLWFASSDAKDIADNCKEFNAILEAKKLENLEYSYTEEPSEKHWTIFRAVKERAMEWTLK